MSTSARTFVESSPTRCPFCHDGVDIATEPWVACATCLARHHAECWEDGAVCAACGRDQKLILAAAPVARSTEPPPPEGAPLVHVARDREGACATLEEALRAVAPGGKVVLAPGRYRENVVIRKTVTIVGTGGRGTVILEPSATDCVVVDTERAAIEGLTVRISVRGLGTESWSAIRVKRGVLRLTDCNLESELLSPCFLVDGAEARPRVENCRIQGRGAAVVVSGGARGTFERSEFVGERYGFSARSDADPEVSSCTFSGGEFGIGVEDGGRGVFKGCEVVGSRTAGIRVITHGKPRFERCKVRDARQDGVRVEDQGEGTFDDCQIYRSGRSGVVVEREGDPHFKHSKVMGGHGIGVSFRANGRGRLEECRVSENAGPGVEIALFSRPVISGCKVRGNEGAGIWVRPQGAGLVERCDLGGNRGGPWRDEGGKTERRANQES